MRIVPMSVELLPYHGLTVEGILRRIEECGRKAYKSEDRVKKGSDAKFYRMLLGNEHWSVFRHVYLSFEWIGLRQTVFELKPEYSKVHEAGDGRIIVTANLQAWLETGVRSAWFTQEGLVPAGTSQFVTTYSHDPIETPLPHIPATIITTVNRAVSHQLVRHKILDYTQESQRYCRYDADVAFIPHSGWDDTEESKRVWTVALQSAEDDYQFAIYQDEDRPPYGLRKRPEQARDLLPNCTATTMAITGTLDAWLKTLNTRCKKDAQPDTRLWACEVLAHLATMWPIKFHRLALEYVPGFE